ncbi:MAG: hypothetical protein AAGA48_31280 [Myxococcota bacterium]
MEGGTHPNVDQALLQALGMLYGSSEAIEAAWWRRGRLDQVVQALHDGTPVLNALHKKERREPSLEAAILADPESRQAAEVYADSLAEQGSPHGALLRAAWRRSPSPRARLRYRRALSAYVESLSLPHDLVDSAMAFWMRGFVRALDLENRLLIDWVAFLQSRSCLGLEALTITVQTDNAHLAWPELPGVRRLWIDDLVRGARAALFDRFPDLEMVVTQTGSLHRLAQERGLTVYRPANVRRCLVLPYSASKL